MDRNEPQPTELHFRAVMRGQSGLFFVICVFGFFVNLLMLTGPIFALQVYDRVLSSRSEETLVALTILMAFLFLIMGILDHARKRVAARIGERIASVLSRSAFLADIDQKNTHGASCGGRFVSDLSAVRRFFSSSAFIASLDLPWVPVFLLGIALFHPWLGWLALIAALAFAAPVLIRLAAGKAGATERDSAALAASTLMLTSTRQPRFIAAMGIDRALAERWQIAERSERKSALEIHDRLGARTTTSQTFRIFLQSSMIALGAYLVLQNELTAGAIIAATVLLARALGPLDMLSQNLPVLLDGLRGCRKLSGLKIAPPEMKPAENSDIETTLRVRQVTVFPPNSHNAAVRLVSFEVGPGQILGVTGPTGSGKSALIKTLTDIWTPAGGSISFGGSVHRASANGNHTGHIGYLPQDVQLFDGTIAENIALFDLELDIETVIAVATAAGAHDMILSLSSGYDTMVVWGDAPLAAGLVQRIGIARAIYRNPKLLLLDEPANNLDADGLKSLRGIIRARKSAGAMTIITSQKPSALQGCDLLLALDQGVQKAFGPANSVLNGAAQNVQPIRAANGLGMVS